MSVRRSFRVILPPALALGILLAFAQPAQTQRRKATQKQENEMLARILWAVQESDGGRDQRLLPFFENIVADIKTLDYSPETRWAAYDTYGIALLAGGDTKRAIQAFSRAVEEARSHKPYAVSLSMTHLGQAHCEAGNYSTAVDHFNAVLEVDRDNLEAQLGLSLTYRKWGLYGLAQTTYSQILATHRDNAAAWEGLGDSHLQAGEFGPAMEAFERLALLPGNQELAAGAFVRLARACVVRGDFASARTGLGRADELAPQSAPVQVDVGWVLLELGDVQKAVQALEKALRLKPSRELRARARDGLRLAKARK